MSGRRNRRNRDALFSRLSGPVLTFALAPAPAPVKRMAVSPGAFRVSLLLLCVSLYVLRPEFAAARDKPLSLGLGVEANMNAVHNVAAAAWFSAALDVDDFFNVGIKAGYSYDASDMGTLELAVLNRWYFIPPKKYRLFTQVELGADLIFHNGKILPLYNGKIARRPVLLGGLAVGWRISFRFGYLEPILRVGFPYIWGSGLGFGWRI